MLPTPIPTGLYCDCCGVIINLQAGDYCPRCGYPVNNVKEEHFLEESIRNLQRVVTYGGAQASVASLLQRYRARLDVVHRYRQYIASVRQSTASEAVAPPLAPQNPTSKKTQPLEITPHIATENASSFSPVQGYVAPTLPVASAPQQMFSARSFFADQTINIVSSLGAFLILVGSLSFVTTTENLVLSFFVLFLVHLIFAAVGFVLAYFPSFRFVARAYSAIAALLVPLVGFTAYRMFVGSFVEVSIPTVVAVAAVYATLVYAVLAISQQYKPFGYLSTVALMLVGLATASALQLNYWWWPVLLMPLAFVGLLAIESGTQRVSSGNTAVLREPVRVMMYACIAILCLDILCTYLYAIVIDITFSEVRIAGAVMLLSVLAWSGAYFWVTKRFAWLTVLPYQLLGLLAAIAYTLNFQQLSYGLLFIAIAVCYHVGVIVTQSSLSRFQDLRNHVEVIVFVLVAFVPLLVAPMIPMKLFSVAYMVRDVQFVFSGDTWLAMIALVVAGAVVVSMVLSHTGLNRTPTHIAWCWALLLSGFLFTWAYSIIALSLHLVPVYAFLALTLALLVGAIVVRRSVSVAWSNVMDVLVLSEVAVTLWLNLMRGLDNNIALLFLFAVLAYIVVFYQRRYIMLCIPVIFMALAFPFLLERPRIMLVLAAVLPLLGLLIAKGEQYRRGRSSTEREPIVTLSSLFSWEWPLLLTGLFYGVVVCGIDAFARTSTMQGWLEIPFSVALELAGLAVIWYGLAAFSRQRWMLVATTGFAVAGLLVYSNPVWVLACLAAVTALLALGIGRVAAKIWVTPLYIVAMLAVVMVGVDGYTGGHGQLSFIAWILLGFALLIYGIGVLENFTPFLWLAAFFAMWSTYDTALLGDLYRAPLIVLVCALLGVGIGCLTFTSSSPKREKLLRFALPFYATAIAAAVLTGVYGMLGNINYPFPAAIPDALLLYAVVAYGVLVFERQPRWLWLVAVFAAWAILLVARLDGVSPEVVFVTSYLTGVALVTGVIGIVVGRVRTMSGSVHIPGLSAFSWSWPWYCASLLAIVVTVAWNSFVGGVDVAGTVVYSSLFAFLVLSFVVALVERRQEVLIVSLLLALWGIVQTHWMLWQQMGALSILFFAVSTIYYLWNLFPSHIDIPWQGRWYRLLGLVGQVLIVLMIIGSGGLSGDTGMLGRVGVGVLLLLAVQLFCYGWMQQEKQLWMVYGAGLLLALAVSWELSVFHQTRIEWLTLAPATYLIVVAPFLSRDERVVQHKQMGQICSIFGAALLLLPTLWSSFSEASILPTFILVVEAFALLLLGVTTRVRFFVLSGAALVVVCAMHALFLPSLGIPPSLALTIMGVTLLGLGTVLSLARHRLQAVWTRLD